MSDADSKTPSRARLQIEGVRSPVLTRVARRRETGMTCVQELPFLRLETPVRDDHGRKARIARVALSVEKDVPKLVIELAYDDDDDFPSSGPPAVHADAGAPPRAEPVDTIPGAPAPELFRRDPIDSLREPPISLRELAASLLVELAEGVRSLERALSALASARPALRLA